jgi:hypothetical protein
MIKILKTLSKNYNFSNNKKRYFYLLLILYCSSNKLVSQYIGDTIINKYNYCLKIVVYLISKNYKQKLE